MAKIETVKKESTKAASKVEANVKASAPKVKTGGLSIQVYSLTGKATGTLDLPKEIFGAKVNKSILSQAMRVYLNNRKSHHSNTKTRGEVVGSTRKIYKQKGTGRARHGANKAPIFVGGGIALGPKFRKVVLDLPKKMKQASLISALAQKMSEGMVLGLVGLDKATGKTSEVVKLANSLLQKADPKKQNSSALILSGEKLINAQRAIRNIPGLTFMTTEQLNTFEVIKHKSLILTKAAVEKLQERLGKDSAKEKKPVIPASEARPESAEITEEKNTDSGPARMTKKRSAKK